jgi:type VI secretion system protein ImpF
MERENRPGGNSAPARSAAQPLTLPSVLDRLLDDEPDQPQRGVSLLYDIKDFKAALARDLEALLNTRNTDINGLFEGYPLAAASVTRYGIADLSSLTLNSPDDRERLRSSVKSAIATFEKRLRQVEVTLNAPEKPGKHPERTLHFRVDAVLQVHPHKPPVVFDATLELSSSAYQVRGGA